MKPISFFRKSYFIKTIQAFIFLNLFLFSAISNAQYSESFDIDGKGILNPGCTGTALSSCSNTDFAGVTWTIGGDLSGIDVEGFFTSGGSLVSLDGDEEACWISPTLDISTVGGVSITATIYIPTGSEWETSTTVGSLDFADVKYSVDGGPFITLANVNGCPGSGHTISAASCATALTGPLTSNPSAIGIIGSTLDIQICFDTNASGDIGNLELVSVPQPGVTIFTPDNPELDVRNNADNADINDASTTISMTLGTDFGTQCATSGTSSRTFRAENNGSTALTFGADALSISNTTDFSITTDLTNNGTVAASGVSTFSIQFGPASAGTKDCIVTIRSNDADEDPYTFNIQGVGSALDNASFNYGAAAYCANDTDPTPTITGLTGGIFSSTAGLSLNASTGVIDVSASTPGSYTVTYTTNGTCPNSSSFNVDVDAICGCSSGNNVFIGMDGNWDDNNNWSLGCVPTSTMANPYVGDVTISADLTQLV